MLIILKIDQVCAITRCTQVSEGGKRVFKTFEGDRKGSSARRKGEGWDREDVTTPYPVSAPFEDKRLLAQVSSIVTILSCLSTAS